MTDVLPVPSEEPPMETIPLNPETQNGATDQTSDPTPPTATEPTESAQEAEQKKAEELSAIAKLKAAQAARRNRRARPPPAPTALTKNTISSAATDQKPDDPVTAALKKAHEEQMTALRQEAASLRLEMGSLRRNHLQNIKRISEERDMFANQLANEQSSGVKPGMDTRKIEDMNVQLRAARTRNNDLENENTTLRDEVKQLNFRVHAGKTLDAASDGYEKIVDELVNVKLKCAQLQEEKEDLLRMNKELMTTSAVLREANGELEKSRSSWVVRCADVEKQKQDLEDKVRDSQSKSTHLGNDPSDSGSLQDIKLN